MKTNSQILAAIAKLEKNLSNTSTNELLLQPQPRQRDFLESDADICLFGGSAGSGKSLSLLLDFARAELLKLPHYGGVIFRRTYPEIRNEGGLWDESGLWYPLLGGVPNESRLSWSFPSGATIRFSHLQHEKDVYRWQGSQLSRVGFDEVTHFGRKMIFYLMSRMRSPHGIKPKMRLTCNPDAESWLAGFIDWWIDPVGYPYANRSGVIRWFIVLKGDVVWGQTKEELTELYPSCQPKSFTFISAKLTDNPALLQKDPGYLANLEAQDPVERARLLDGNWKARKSESKLFDDDSILRCSDGAWMPPQKGRYLVACDPNFGGADFFEVQVWKLEPQKVCLVHEWRSQKQSVVSSIAQMINIINLYNPLLTAVESNSGGKIVLERLHQELPGRRFEGVLTTATSKVVNTDRLAISLLNQELSFPPDWIGIPEMHNFAKHSRQAASGYDDAVMCASVMCAFIDRVSSRSPIGSTSY